MVKKKDKKRRFKGGVSRNAAKQQRGTAYGHLNLPKGISVFKEEPKSRMNLDILPYVVTDANHLDRDDEYEVAVPGELWYKRPYYLHRNIGANNESIVCPTTAGQKCPICEHRAQLLKDGADWGDDAVKALKPSMRNLYVVVPKGAKKYEETPHIWDISQFLFQEKLNEEIQENEEYETFPDLEEGFTLRIRFSEESFGANKFAETSRIDFIDRKEPYDDSILDEVPSLDEILGIPSYKVVEALFFGGMSQDEIDDEDGDDDDITDEDVPFDEDDEQDKEEIDDDGDNDDDAEEAPDEEEDEKEEKPKRRRSSAKDKDKAKDKAKDKKKDDRCPHGHKFGDDCEDHDECDECDEWEDCMDAADAK